MWRLKEVRISSGFWGPFQKAVGANKIGGERHLMKTYHNIPPRANSVKDAAPELWN